MVDIVVTFISLKDTGIITGIRSWSQRYIVKGETAGGRFTWTTALKNPPQRYSLWQVWQPWALASTWTPCPGHLRAGAQKHWQGHAQQGREQHLFPKHLLKPWAPGSHVESADCPFAHFSSLRIPGGLPCICSWPWLTQPYTGQKSPTRGCQQKAELGKGVGLIQVFLLGVSLVKNQLWVLPSLDPDFRITNLREWPMWCCSQSVDGYEDGSRCHCPELVLGVCTHLLVTVPPQAGDLPFSYQFPHLQKWNNSNAAPNMVVRNSMN